MTWRLVNWILWTAMVLLLVLGTLRIIGQHYVWLAALLATVVEMISVALKGQAAEATPKPLTLTDEMIRTQNRSYERVLKGLQSGQTIQYETLRLRAAADTLDCHVTRPDDNHDWPAADWPAADWPAADWPAADWPAAEDDDSDQVLRSELGKAQATLERLRRWVPEIDDLARSRSQVLTLLDSDARTPLAQLVDGRFQPLFGTTQPGYQRKRSDRESTQTG